MCLFFYVCVPFMMNDTWFKFASDFTPFLTMVQLFMLPVETGLLKFQYKTNLYLTLMSKKCFIQYIRAERELYSILVKANYF